MSKMGEELEKRLDENKYELYEALKEIIDLVEEGNYEIDSFTTQPARLVIRKIERG